MSHTPDNDPPELNDDLLKLLKPEDLPPTSVPWEDSKRDRPVDILLLTAKECEFLSCISHLNPGFYKSWMNGLGYVYFGRIDGENESLKIAVVQCKVGSVEPQASLVVVPSAVEALRPKAVINVGYCGRLNNKVGLGDVIISSKLRTYSTGKKSGGGFEDRNISVPLSPAFAQLVLTANYGWQKPLKDRGKLKVKVFTDGVVFSGPLVVDDEELRKELLERGSDAIAVEMEGQGLYSAAHNLGIEWVIIKGVSDYADGTKSSTNLWRPFASAMAASLTFKMLRDTRVFKEWKHYERPTTGTASPKETSDASTQTEEPIGLATSDTSTQTEKAEGYGLSEPSITSISGAETKREDPDGSSLSVEDFKKRKAAESSGGVPKRRK